MHRLFVALRPPGHVRDLLIDTMEGVDLRWQDDDQLHLTLRFVGEVERPLANDLAAALSTIVFPKFDLAIQGVGRFDRGRRGALWAGVRPKDPLHALASKVERACQSAGLEPERRAYHPHITLARWNGGKPQLDSWLNEHAGLRSEPFTATDFILYESRLGQSGAHYEPVATFALV
ncbi:RNA 2',3'-cyclic phosphodiesterase [Sphingomonas sp. HDW15A]|uniref:RNA 2',3'-cyclic phosphodiesterase n=1 Tax=Sphingomonas sp. HDW15A TaxID=2714942 RepID=UPI0014084C80|nr:RNA 2',3'-cyclic phosphodiesterase [Sphingomonas sp. HDW15A]QIK95538.1 RNA 2',3'-cyclic phosphodiesterase [Sphingomonas sp. HDW15A]